MKTIGLLLLMLLSFNANADRVQSDVYHGNNGNVTTHSQYYTQDLAGREYVYKEVKEVENLDGDRTITTHYFGARFQNKKVKVIEENADGSKTITIYLFKKGKMIIKRKTTKASSNLVEDFDPTNFGDEETNDSIEDQIILWGEQ